MTYVIFDLDNCLCNDEWRIPKIDWSQTDMLKRYHHYHADCGRDEPGAAALEVYRAQIAVATPIFLTARPVSCADETRAWIKRHLRIEKPLLLMRNLHDHTPSTKLKRKMLDQLSDFHEIERRDILAAYDDRDDVVEMYRSCGLDGRVLRIHSLCAMTPPAPPLPKRAPDILAAAADTFRQRNALYGDNYLRFGKICAEMFPDGVTLTTSEDFNRFGIFVQCLAKFTRYSANMERGGHEDSAMDLSVYAAMLVELTNAS